jgi:hypothetical protein
VTLGQDWPTEELRDILNEYGFRILGRERRRSGRAPWRRTSPGQQISFDAQASWTETHYTIRRDKSCEVCGQGFGYSFEVDQVSRVHRNGRSTDGSLRREMGRQSRRRLRCPHCRAVQKEPRRTLLRQGRKQAALGCGVVLGGIVLLTGLGVLGGWLAGTIGVLVGLLVALASLVVLWFVALPYVLSIGPSI